MKKEFKKGDWLLREWNDGDRDLIRFDQMHPERKNSFLHKEFYRSSPWTGVEDLSEEDPDFGVFLSDCRTKPIRKATDTEVEAILALFKLYNQSQEK